MLKRWGKCRLQAIWKYDYAGIVVLIVTSFMPPVYYGFLCQPLLRNFYLISTVSLGAPAIKPTCPGMSTTATHRAPCSMQIQEGNRQLRHTNCCSFSVSGLSKMLLEVLCMCFSDS